MLVGAHFLLFTSITSNWISSTITLKNRLNIITFLKDYDKNAITNLSILLIVLEVVDK